MEFFSNRSETTIPIVADGTEEPTAIRTDLGAIFISLELNESLAEDDGELGLSLEPLTRRPFLLLGRVVSDRI
ncbi:MAG: hypothetical protein EOR16_33975 [Mesorhizobium sp.]|nr:MAG: hypothetical protein EOR16_33975 [Mesorhizobium sp.]TJV29052.1 MAG: hypothetical protein E5X87_33970 [Mesorhizobium sp.]TJW49898.1 MAG: hypothetical protein E5X59_10190 [Mesorhizobium sp.]